MTTEPARIALQGAIEALENAAISASEAGLRSQKTRDRELILARAAVMEIAAQAKPEPDPAGVIPVELRMLSEKATPGEWMQWGENHARFSAVDQVDAKGKSRAIGQVGGYEFGFKQDDGAADQRFIVAAVNFVRQRLATPSPKPSVPDRREAAAALCEARAEYFEANKRGHWDRSDMARSYRATANEIRHLPSPDVVRGEPDGGWLPISTCPADIEEAILGGRYPNGQPWVRKTYRRFDRQWVGCVIDKPTHWQPVPDKWSIPAAPTPPAPSGERDE